MSLSKNTITIIVLLVVVVALAMGFMVAKQGGQENTTTAPLQTTTSEQIVVTDFRGREISLSKPAERIVVLSSYWAEILVALGAGDRIIGIGSYVPYDHYLPDNIRSKTVVGSVFKGINLEQLVALNPDVVVMDYGYGKTDEIIKQIEDMGIPVVALFMRNISDELRAIEILGKITGATSRAEELEEFITTRLEKLHELSASIPSDERLRVVVVSGTSILRGGQLSVYSNTSWGRMVEDIGAINTALREMPGEKWPKVDFETLAAWDPDAIIIVSSVSKINDVLDKIASDPVWSTLKAYKMGRIYVVPCWSSIGGVLDWGPRDIIGREYIASILYPEVYGEVNWRSDMEYLLSRFYGVFVPRQAFASYSIEWKEIVDMTGSAVKIPRKINRVVDLITYETLIAFNATDKLVGVSKYAKTNILVKTAFPEIEEIPSPGSSFSLNIEDLAALKPDVVFIWPYKEKIVEEIEALGIPVIKISLYSYEDIKRLLWLLGAVFDMRERASSLIDDMDTIVHMVQERVSSIPMEERTRVLYLWSKPTKVQGGRGTVNDFINLAGGVNVAAGELADKTYVSVDLETIIKWNPEVIVIWYHARYNESTILDDPLWSPIKAVREHRVYKEPYYEHWNMDASLFILWLAQKMYPDKFSDISFVDIADKYYSKWYGVSYHQAVGAGD